MGGTVAVIVLAIVVIALVAKCFERKFTCACGRTLRILGSDHCPDCFRYYKKESGSIRELGPGTVEKSPLFEARRSRIPDFPSRWIWPDCCCVCGGRAVRYDDMIVTHMHFLNGRMEGRNFTVKVPYCRAHRYGVRFGASTNRNATDTDQTSILFSSYDYWQGFLRANGIRRPE